MQKEVHSCDVQLSNFQTFTLNSERQFSAPPHHKSQYENILPSYHVTPHLKPIRLANKRLKCKDCGLVLHNSFTLRRHYQRKHKQAAACKRAKKDSVSITDDWDGRLVGSPSQENIYLLAFPHVCKEVAIGNCGFTPHGTVLRSLHENLQNCNVDTLKTYVERMLEN